MKKLVSTKILLFALVVLVTFSCNQKPVTTVKNDSNFNYQTYVYNHTSGIKSVKSTIYVSLAQLSQIDEKSLQEVLTFSPSIDGEIQIINQKQLMFSPKKDLKENTTYIASLDLNKLYPNQQTKQYKFSFKTKKQDFEIKTQKIQSYDQDWQYISGEIITSDLANLEKVKQVITAEQNNKSIAVKFDSITVDSSVFSFKIDSIYRNLNDSKIYVNYNGKSLGVNKKEKREIHIHGKNNFKIVDIKVVNDAEQYVEVNFTDPLDKNQYLNGLVSIENTNNLKFVIVGNLLKIYPKNTLKGQLNVSLRNGIKNSYGYKFKTTQHRNLSFDEPKPQIKFEKSGNILPDSENLNIQFQAINLKAVELKIYKIFESNILQFLQQNELQGKRNFKMVGRPILKKIIPLKPKNNSEYHKWQTYGLALESLINIDKGAIYKIELDYEKSFSTYKCNNSSIVNTTPIKEENYDTEDLESSNWDNNNYYNDYEGYNWNERDDPCTDSYYANKSIYKNILASDIGLIVKKGNDNSYFIATNNTVTSAPLDNVKITFYNYQQQAIKSIQTDNNGIATINLNKVPFFVTAQKNGQTTYIKVNDGNVLSMSNFNTRGVTPKKGLKGYIYAERGVWRPGDTIHLGFMLNDIENKLPKNHPITLELKDPHNTLKYRKVKNLNDSYLVTYKAPTKANHITGNWQASISVGGATFYKTLKVETIKPNRIKINVKTDNKILANQNKVNISAKWLHGAIAKNLKAECNLTLKPLKTTFNHYPNYVFNDPSKYFKTDETLVSKSNLDSKGETSFILKTKTGTNAPGMLKAYLTTRVYENGGDFSTDVYTKTYSPFNTYTGIKRPTGDKARNMLLTDKQHSFDLVSVNKEGKPVSNQKLEIIIYKLKQSWWYSNSNNYSQFSSSNFQTIVYSRNVTTNTNGKANFKFEIKYPEWGRYFIKVTNKKSGHSTGESVFVDWPGWAGKAKKGNQKEATMLVFTTDKDVYQVNDEIQINFPSSENGHALITLENNNKVLRHYRIKTNKESTRFTCKADIDMTPNIFINVTTLQPHNNTKNNLPIRMYGLKNISIENKASHLTPILKTPKEVEPKEEFIVKVSEKNQRSFTYTLAIVDEGLLDLTRFKTPNPWNTFYAKQALGVKTWDMYNEVIGAFGGKLNQIFSIGGDQDLGAAKTQKANRFKPVVVFKGPFTLNKNETNTHKITLPQYIGSVKAMVVAHNANQEAYGNANSNILVKKPLMLLASAPRKVSTNEQIKVPVTVFNSLEGKQKVKVTLKTNDIFNIDGAQTQEILFNEPGDKIAYFNLKAVKNGIGKITLKARNKTNSANYAIELDSYNPISEVTKNKKQIINANETLEINIDGFGIDGTNQGNIEYSTFPQINFTDRLKYLIRYPHGCLEQTTSAVFPQLYIDDLFETSLTQRNKITQNIQKGIQKLENFILLSGGFSYWPGNSKVNNWATNYAGHFLLEAEQRGYTLPYNFKNNWIAYQKQVARVWRKKRDNTYIEQAYRLYTLALAKSPELSIMNRLREDKNISNIAKLRLALAYVIIGQKQAGLELMQSASLINYSKVYQINHGTTLANKAIALETFRALNNIIKARELLEDITNELNGTKYINTKTTAMCLLAVHSYYSAINNKGVYATTHSNNSKVNIQSEKSIHSQKISLQQGMNRIKIENKNDKPLYVLLTHSGIPKMNKEENISKNINSYVTYLDNNGKQISIDNLPQGTSFNAEIIVKNLNNKPVKDIATSYHIPSGWELLNTRYATGETSNHQADYIDIRDNAVHLYFDLNANESKKFKVKINTTYLGNYYLPGIHTEAMYDNNYMSHTKGSWIYVTP